MCAWVCISRGSEGLSLSLSLPLSLSLDFSENCAFIAQDTGQLFHYNNNQCSLTTIVIYYKVSNSKIEHKNMAVFSDNLIHSNTVAVYLIKKL